MERKQTRFKDGLLDPTTVVEPNEARFNDRLLVLVFSSIRVDVAGEPAGSMAGPKEQKTPKGKGEGRGDSGGVAGGGEDRELSSNLLYGGWERYKNEGFGQCLLGCVR